MVDQKEVPEKVQSASHVFLHMRKFGRAMGSHQWALKTPCWMVESAKKKALMTPWEYMATTT
jgi:hypothetical protein